MSQQSPLHLSPGSSINIDTETAAQHIRNYAIGFALMGAHKPTPNRMMETSNGAGSGTLVKVGGIRGVLTAAHVIEALPMGRDIGILTGPRDGQIQRTTFVREGDDAVVARAENWNKLGPDLGFLRLPKELSDDLGARCSFLKIDADNVSQNYRGKLQVTLLIGVLAEQEAIVESSPTRTLKRFGICVFDGLADLGSHEVRDVVVFDPSKTEEFKQPVSYEGVSGGGLWHVFFDPTDTSKSIGHRLIGVPFFEEPDSTGTLRIYCQGRGAVHSELSARILHRWSSPQV